MNDLVERLSRQKSPVTANKPDTTIDALKHRIALNYVHIYFETTGTEIGMQLDLKRCDVSDEAFKNGRVHLEGVLTLNYDNVRCVADINLDTMKGEGRLETVDDLSFAEVVNQK